MTTHSVKTGEREYVIVSDNPGEDTVSISAHDHGDHGTTNMTRDQWAELQLRVGMLFGPAKESASGEMPPVAFGITCSKARPDTITFSVMAPEMRQPMAWDVDREQWADIKKSIDTHFNKGESA